MIVSDNQFVFDSPAPSKFNIEEIDLDAKLARQDSASNDGST